MLIGRTIRITEAKNKSIEGRKGLVIDETKNTLTLAIAGKELKIIKDQVITIIEEQS
jgi:RNase P/RNase MRP subunit p29